jgi:hypothetical protein
MAVTPGVRGLIGYSALLGAAMATLWPALAVAQGLTGPIDLAATQKQAAAIGVAEKIVRDAFGGGRAYRIEIRQEVRFREQINTGAASGAEFRFVDGTSLSLGENADVKLDEFVYDPDRNLLRGSVNVLKGTMRFVGSSARKDVAINTPAGTIGIRGTSFNLRVGNRRFDLQVVSGEVQVVSGGTQQTVRANEFVRVSDGLITRRSPPRSFGAAMTQIAASLGALTVAAGESKPPVLAEIRDAGGRIVGYTLTRGDGRMEALDRNRRMIAYFDPTSDATYAPSGRRLSPGNRVPSLASGER